MVSTIRYSANASSDHHPNQVPGILIIMNPKQPNLPTCSVTSTYLLFHLLSNPSLHLIANTTLGIIMTAIKISPKTLSHSILSTITNMNWDFIYSKGFNNCYILLSNISQSLENTKFIAGELSLIVSLALYRPTSVYELW